MFKFLRKYNKWILAVGGTLLMITFLIPQAIQSLSQRAGQRSGVVATLDDKKVNRNDWEEAMAEAQLIQRLNAMGLPGLTNTLASSAESPEHWYLMVHEAEQANLVGGELLATNAAVFLAKQPSLSQSPRVIARTLSKVDGVNRLAQLYANTSKYSDQRLLHYAKTKFLNVRAEMVFIDADDEQSLIEPTEEELVEQLATYGDVDPGSGTMGFGYKLPDRAKYELLIVEVDAVREMIRNSDEMDEVALRMYWRRHIDDEELGFPEITQNTAIPEMVRGHLLRELTRQKMDDIAKFSYDELRKRQRGLPVAEDGYFTLPDDWEEQQLSFPELATLIQDEFQIPAPIYTAPGQEWTAVNEIGKEKPFAKIGSDRFGTSEMPFQDLIAAAREFDQPSAAIIQQGVAGPPLRPIIDEERPDPTPDAFRPGDPLPVYLFRIIETDPSRPPHSVDEVREDLVRDLKRADHYQQLLEEMPSIETKAQQEGLLATAMAHGSSVSQETTVALIRNDWVSFLVRQRQMLREFPSTLPVIGQDIDTIQAILDRALELPENAVFKDLPDEQRIFALPIENHLSILVVQLNSQIPLTDELFRQMTAMGSLQGMIAMDELALGENLKNAFSFDALAERHNFAFAKEDDEDEEDAPEESTPPADDTGT